MKRYQERKVIGRGNFGTALLVKDLTNGHKAVVKRIPLLSLSEKERRDAETECKLLANLVHPNIVEFIESFLENESLHLVTEYCERGDLGAVIRDTKKRGRAFSEIQVMDWFIQIAMAVDYIHSLNIMHRDLKTGNVFLTKTNVIKLGDFGIAKVLDNTLERASTVVGTPYFMSPEVCENKSYDSKSDLWAMGCILYELCTLKHAFDANNLLGLVVKIVQENYEPVPTRYSPELGDLVAKLLSKTPGKRPSCRKIFRLSFIKQRLEQLAKASELWNGEERSISYDQTSDLAGHEQLDQEGALSFSPSNGSMTPASLRKERKAIASRQREEQLRLAAAQGKQGRTIARRRSEMAFQPSAENNLVSGELDHQALGDSNEEADEQQDFKHSVPSPMSASSRSAASTVYSEVSHDDVDQLAPPPPPPPPPPTSQQQQQQQQQSQSHMKPPRKGRGERGERGFTAPLPKFRTSSGSLSHYMLDRQSSLDSPLGKYKLSGCRNPSIDTQESKTSRSSLEECDVPKMGQHTEPCHEARQQAQRRSTGGNGIHAVARSRSRSRLFSSGSGEWDESIQVGSALRGSGPGYAVGNRHRITSAGSSSGLTTKSNSGSHGCQSAQAASRGKERRRQQSMVQLPSATGEVFRSRSDSASNRPRSGSTSVSGGERTPTSVMYGQRRKVSGSGSSVISAGHAPRWRQQQQHLQRVRSATMDDTKEELADRDYRAMSHLGSFCGDSIGGSSNSLSGRQTPCESLESYDERPIRASGSYCIDSFDDGSSTGTCSGIPPADTVARSSSLGLASPTGGLFSGMNREASMNSFASAGGSCGVRRFSRHDSSSSGASTIKKTSSPVSTVYSDEFDSENDLAFDLDESSMSDPENLANHSTGSTALRELASVANISLNGGHQKQSSEDWNQQSQNPAKHGVETARVPKMAGSKAGSGPDWMQIAGKQERRLRTELGEDKFDHVYQYLKEMYDQGTGAGEGESGASKKKRQNKLRQLVGKEKLNLAFEVDQLLYIQFMSNNK